MAIAAYAVGANEGYIYVRGEYRLAQERLKTAIHQAERWVSRQKYFRIRIFFDIHVHSGAGAYICGEETALIESIEGKRENHGPPPLSNHPWLMGKTHPG